MKTVLAKAKLSALVASLVFFDGLAQRSVEIPMHNHFWVDAQGNIFLQTEYTIEKYSSDGNRLARWSTPRRMAISSFDGSNNLKILVFYRDFNQIQYLNQNLIEISPQLDLSTAGIALAVAVCQASNGEIWVADQQQNSIFRVSSNFSILYSFSFRLFGETADITRMCETNQQLFVLMQEHWMVFDLFGQKINQINIKGLDKAQINVPETWYVDENTLMEYDFRSNTSSTIQTINGSAYAAYRYKTRTYLLEKNRMTIIP